MRSFLICTLLFAFITTAPGQGIQFFDGHWKEALELANKEDKLVFVDAFATWCGPCKRMAKTVFVDEEVGQFYNDNFINLKIDMEKGQGLEFRKEYPVSAFPTLYYLNGSGKVILKEIGAKDVKTFIQTGKLAIRKNDKSDIYAQEYEKGNRDHALVLNYVKALNQAEKPSLKIANEYISSNPDIDEGQMALFVLESTTEADSRIFDMLINRRDLLKSVVDDQTVYERILKACENTVEKAIEFESLMLVEEATQKLKDCYAKEGKSFEIKAQMNYYEGIGDFKSYLNYLEQYASEIILEDPEQLHQFAEGLLSEYRNRPAAMQLGEKLCLRALEKEESIDCLITYSKILVSNHKNEKALEMAEKALELTKLEGQPTRNIDGLIRFIKSQQG